MSRQTPPPSEAARLLAPLLRAADAIFRRVHWWLGALLALYAVSGITVVQPDEAAVVLRFGAITGNNPAEQVHSPGPLLAFPWPIDEVVHIKVRRVAELTIDTLSNGGTIRAGDSLDPTRIGYALTGDQNIVHLDVVARYQITDPVAWMTAAPDTETVLRTDITAALVRSIGEQSVDSVLSDGRKDLVTTATARAQADLDEAHAGVTLASIELTSLAPPAAVQRDFDEVQSAYIKAETQRKDAQAYRESQVPKAQADADAGVRQAKADAAAALAKAQGDADAFVALAKQEQADPAVVRERLYRDGIEKAISDAGKVRWVPPPVGARYSGLRVTLPTSVAMASPTSPPATRASPATIPPGDDD